jgi:hypothetical protein
MTAAQTRIAETIDAFYGEAGTRDNVSAYYRQAVEDLDAQTVKELVNPPSLPLPPPPSPRVHLLCGRQLTPLPHCRTDPIEPV